MQIDDLSMRASATLSYLVEAQELHALNIANINNDGYIAQSINFDRFMNLISTGKQNDRQNVASAIYNATTPNIANVSLDDQIAKSEQIATRYDSLLEVLGRHMSLYSIAANRGR